MRKIDLYTPIMEGHVRVNGLSYHKEGKADINVKEL